MVSWQWPWSKKGLVQRPKSVNIFLGFFFLVNFCVGTGFLGIPYTFFYAGYLAAIPTLLLIAFAAWNAGRWEIEVMARAQVRTVSSLVPRLNTALFFRRVRKIWSGNETTLLEQ